MSTRSSTAGDGSYKIKRIRFFGREVPIILQNRKGPCSLIAIWNYLLLKKRIHLPAYMQTVEGGYLNQLVAEPLLNSSSSSNNKDSRYSTNQEKIDAALNMLSDSASGMNVNVRFRRIHDFVPTKRCAIFDLLGIPLCHGWLVDPQDWDTANAIGDRSFETLQDMLVAANEKMASEAEKSSKEARVDFAAATTAVNGTISDPSKSQLIHDSSVPLADHHNIRRGDLEKETGLLGHDTENIICAEELIALAENMGNKQNNSSRDKCDYSAVATAATPVVLSLSVSGGRSSDDSSLHLRDVRNKERGNLEEETELLLSLKLSAGGGCSSDKDEGSTESFDSSSLLCGEEGIEALGTTPDQNEESLHWDESNLEELEERERVGCNDRKKDELTLRECKLIGTFLKENECQLTVHGLFTLRDELEEGEVYVFYGYSHFSIMIKFEGQLYTLVTDQNYLTQANVVWEKLNDVSGNRVHVTHDFKELNAAAQAERENEQKAMPRYDVSRLTTALKEMEQQPDSKLETDPMQGGYEQHGPPPEHNLGQPAEGGSRPTVCPQQSKPKKKKDHQGKERK